MGPVEPWIGVLDALGVLLAALVWYAVRDAGDRVRSVVAAFGAVLLFAVVPRVFGEAASVLGLVTSPGFGPSEARRVIDVLLMLAGTAAGVVAVFAAHHAVAEAGEELADDDDDDDDRYEVRAQLAAVSLAPWVDVLALALALGLPTVATGSAAFFAAGQFGRSADFTVVAAAYHVLSGLLAAGALLAVVRRRELREGRPAAAAFGLVAVGALVVPLAAETFANEFWTAFAVGLAAGLVAATVVRLVARGLPEDRVAVTAGALAALALTAILGMLSVRVINEVSEFHGSFQSGWTEYPDADPPSGP